MSNAASSTKEIHVDVAVIGGGVMGIALARQLLLVASSSSPDAASTASSQPSSRPTTVALVEALPFMLCGASAGNSAMIHCGFDCTTGTVEHAMVVRGHRLFSEYAADCARRGLYLPWVPSGAIMLAMSNEEMSIVRDDILPKAVANGVTNTKLLTSREEVLALEPHVHLNVVGGLHVPSEWIVDPWRYPALLLAEAATAPGLSIIRSCRVTSVRREEEEGGGGPYHQWYRLFDHKGQCRVKARMVVNCAGLKGDAVEALLHSTNHSSPPPRLAFDVFPRLGRFIQFGPEAAPLVQRALLPIPTKKSKGIIVFRTVYGQVFVGPTAEDPDEPRASQSAVVKSLRNAASSKVPALKDVQDVAAYAGARPALRQRQDYLIDLDSRDIGWFTVAGVRSTGLTASLAVAELVAPRVLQQLLMTTSSNSSSSCRASPPQTVAPYCINSAPLPSAEAVNASLQMLLGPGGPLSYDRRHPISSEGCPTPKL